MKQRMKGVMVGAAIAVLMSAVPAFAYQEPVSDTMPSGSFRQDRSQSDASKSFRHTTDARSDMRIQRGSEQQMNRGPDGQDLSVPKSQRDAYRNPWEWSW